LNSCTCGAHFLFTRASFANEWFDACS
jgi:hypothetical protein